MLLRSASSTFLAVRLWINQKILWSAKLWIGFSKRSYYLLFLLSWSFKSFVLPPGKYTSQSYQRKMLKYKLTKQLWGCINSETKTGPSCFSKARDALQNLNKNTSNQLGGKEKKNCFQLFSKRNKAPCINFYFTFFCSPRLKLIAHIKFK